MITKEQGSDKAVGASDSVIYKIDVPANRWVLGVVYVHIGLVLYVHIEYVHNELYILYIVLVWGYPR